MTNTDQDLGNPAEQYLEQPAIVWLNMSGDVTITWDEGNKDVVRALVEQKMAEGYHFFVLQPRFLKFLGNRKVPMKKASDMDRASGVVMPDAVVNTLVERLGDPQLEELVRKGKARLTPVQRPKTLDTSRRAKTADEVLKSQALAIRPVVGG